MVIDSEPITMQQATLLHDLAADRAVELDPSTIEHALSSRAAQGMDPQLDRERRELLQAREQIDRRLAQLDQLLEPRYPASWNSLDREQARSVIDWLKRQPVPDLQSRVALAITAGPGDQTEPILLDVTCGYCGAAAGTPCFTKFGEVRWDNPHKPRIELADAEQLVEHARERRRQARAAADAGGDEDWSERTEMSVPAPGIACPSCRADPGQPCVNHEGRINAGMHQPRALIAGVPATSEAAWSNVALWVSCGDHGSFKRYESSAPIQIPAGKTFGTCPRCSLRLVFDGWCDERHAQFAAAAAAAAAASART